MAGCAARRGAARRSGGARPAPAPAPRSVHSPSASARLGRARPVRRVTLTETRSSFCFCCCKTKYSYRNDGKTEKTDVSVPVVAEQRAREDQSRPPRPEGDRGGQEGGRALALHGRQDYVGREGGRG